MYVDETSGGDGVKRTARWTVARWMLAGLVALVALMGTHSLQQHAAFGAQAYVGADLQSHARPLKGRPKVPKKADPAAAYGCWEPRVDKLWTEPESGTIAGRVQKYLELAKAFIPTFEGKLSLSYTIKTCVDYPKRYSKRAVSYANTLVTDANGQGQGQVAMCWIEVNPHLLPLSSGQTIKNTMAHELFHCFQGVALDLPAAWQRPWHDWVIEGQAEWAAAAVAGPDKDDPNWWSDYLHYWDVALADIPSGDGYREIGFYSHLQESNISPWQVIIPMLKSPGDGEAFHAAVFGKGEGAANAFLDSWASGFFRDGSRGRAWDTTGPGVPSGRMRQPDTLSVPKGGVSEKSARPYTQGVYALSARDDVIDVVPTGHVRISDQSHDLVLTSPGQFCIKAGGCECPPGTLPVGPHLTDLHSGGVDIALTGGESGAAVTVSGESLDHYCAKGDPCLIGTWNLTDSSAYWNWLVAQGRSPGDAVAFDGTEGEESMTFRRDGTAELDAANFVMFFKTSTGNQIDDAQSGALTAQWTTPQVGNAELTAFDNGAFTNNLEYGSYSDPVTLLYTPWFRTLTAISPALTPVGPYVCSGSTLTWWMTISKESPPMIFTRKP